MSLCCGFLCAALRIYWKILFAIIYPLALLPVFVLQNTAEYRCLYVVLLMAGYWVFEALPLAITALIPTVLFPLMGILPSNETAMCYMKETNMMFIGGLIIAVAIEHCNLHTRVSLHVIRWVGCSPRRLNVGLTTVTMLVSMWISNTATAAMMTPIISSTVRELEAQGIGSMYEPIEDETLVDLPKNYEPERRPTKTTMCYFISTAYAATIGGTGTIVGSGTNLTLKGIYEARFPDSPGLQFNYWSAINIPMMLVRMALVMVWLQFYFMGLFRPNSADARNNRVSDDNKKVANDLITAKVDALGPMTFHERAVAVVFVMVIVLWVLRKPEVFPGWAQMITQHKVGDSVAAMIGVFVFFFVPSLPTFVNICKGDESERPKKASSGLLTWRVIEKELPWGLVFLIGGGFAIAEGAKVSGMSVLIAESLKDLETLPRYAILVIACSAATVLTQFMSSNVAAANIMQPLMAETALVLRVHPMYLMMPINLACGFSHLLPVSTPPNAIAAAACNFPSWEMVKAGLGTVLVSLAVMYSMFPSLASLLYDFDTFPEWAEN